ncbi:MAG: hypothetical protein KKA65_02665 [Nanoarchaeota archaeon]|nr:hypothetical protein [Nanoarchaeota archaeon]MBU4352631.1 hypothetical protein [Nanoarchaeota archaeon]MBU4456380.1 hypothetical protein [Nanoarchaeota archaeon]MCG2719151.1 hypothetical protein [Nanoarchaeota archaeon]
MVLNLELIEFESVVRKIVTGEKVVDLEKKLDKWHKNNPSFLTKNNCNHILSIVINENRYLQGEKVPEPYLNSRKEHLKTLRKCL